MPHAVRPEPAPIRGERPRVFLSYARDDDEAFVGRLADALERGGVAVWWDRRAMPSRSLTFLEEIRRAIDGVDRMIAVMGPAAMASDYVRCEWQYALARDKPVVPVLRLGDYALPPELRNLHCPDCRATRSFKDALDEILRVLSEPLPALGRTVGLPSLPAHFRPRPDVLSRLADTVMLDQRAPATSVRWQRVTVLGGMGGTGKSVLASAFARSLETRRAFCDGVFWLDLRRVPSAGAALETLVQVVADAQDGGIGARDHAGEQRLARLLSGKRCLLVLDNVETVPQIEAIVRCLDATGRILVTSRDPRLLGEAHPVHLAGLDPGQARHQLADWLELSPQQLDADCDVILEVCEGLPFAIALCGALIAGGASRSAVARKLREMDLADLRQRFPDYDYPGILPCLEVSVDAIERASPQARACLEAMSVFPAGALIPQRTLFLLWSWRLGVDEAAGSLHLSLILRQSLARLEEQNRISLHQLVLGYLVRRVPDQVALHESLLSAYARIASPDWVHGPDDGYYYAHLVHHLLTARGVDQASALLVSSPDWMREKLRLHGSMLSYLVDLDLTLSAASGAGEDVLLLAQLFAAKHQALKGPRSFGRGMLGAMVRVGLAEGALDFARANVDLTSKTGQLLEIYDALLDSRDEREALLEEIEDVAARTPDSVAAGDIRLQLIRRHADASRLDEALRLWELVPIETHDFARVIGSALSRRLCDDQRNEDARRVRERLSQAGIEPFPLSEVITDVDAAERRALLCEDEIERDFRLMYLVDHLARAGDYLRARETALKMARASTRLNALGSIPWAPCLKEAIELAREGEGKSEGSDALHLVFCAGLLHRFRQSGPSEPWSLKIRRWFSDLPTLGPEDTVDGLVAEAERRISALEPGQRVIPLRALATSAPCRALGQSRRLLLMAIDTARAMDASLEQASTLAEFAGDLAALEDDPAAGGEARALLGEAIAVAEASSHEKATARARLAVADVLARAGHADTAIALADEIPDQDCRRDALRRIAATCADSGQLRCLESLRLRCPDERDVSISMAVALAQAGRVEQALQMASELRYETVHARIAEVLLGRDQVDRAVALLKGLSQDEPKYLGAAALIKYLCSRTGRSGVEPLLEVATAIARSIASPIQRSMSLAEVAFGEAKLGRPEAEQHFDRAIELANTKVEGIFLPIGGPSPNFVALSEVGRRMIGAGLGNKALALAETLESRTEDEWRALRAMLIAKVAGDGLRTGEMADQTGAKLFEEALECASRTRDSMIFGPAWHAAAVAEISKSLAEAGQFRRAFEVLGEVHFLADPFIIGFCGWRDVLEARQEGLALSAVGAVARIFGWRRPDWAAVAAGMAGMAPSAAAGR